MYWRIKRGTFIEIVVSALLGMTISLFAVLYLVGQIKSLNKIIDGLKNQEPIIIYVENESEKKEQVEDIIVENKTEIKSKTNSQIRYEKLEVDDRELLARLLYCEGRGESVECQKAIMSVIMNRVNSGYWGNTVSSVVYAKGQFSPVSSGAINSAKPSQTQYDVVDYVLENGSTLPSWVMYFRASYHFNWNGYTPYCCIDNTYFGGYNK